MSEPIHVMAGALVDDAGRVLIAQRPPGKHLAGRWEFPGGKRDPEETPGDGLRRELREELGIEVQDAEPLLKVVHAYDDRRVLIDCWRVTRWRGTPQSLDGQQLRWCDRDELLAADILEADRPIVTALRLAMLMVRAESPASIRARLERRPQRRERIAWLLPESWTDDEASALLATLRERGDLLLGIDHLRADYHGAVFHAATDFSGKAALGQLVGAIVDSTATALDARTRGADFLVVLGAAVLPADIERLARLSLPLYVDVSTPRPGGTWSAAGKVWWRA